MTPQDVMNLHAKSFSLAARFLSSTSRSDAAKLYAFARFADDLADEESLGNFANRMRQLDELERAVLHPELGKDLAHQVGSMLLSKGVSAEVIRTFMVSLRQDAAPRHVQTTEELLEFAYGVAGTVGQMMCPILVVAPEGESYAVALGLAMQLTNIARDVVEDAVRGRCYIPAQWGADAQELRAPQTPVHAARSFKMIEKILHMADEFYAYALQGLTAIPADNRRAIRIAAALYRGIGRKILANGAGRYWQGRTSLGRFEKIKLIVACYAGSDQVPTITGRDRVVQAQRHLTRIPGFPAAG